MATNKTEITPSAVWTEVEYSAHCSSPYLGTPIYIPEETSYFLCREDGTRLQRRLTFVVFRQEGAGEDDWEDDPMIGRLEICVLGDGDEEVRPVSGVYLGVSPDEFVSVVRNDEQEIVFDLTWNYGDIRVDKAQKTDEGYVVKKADFGEDGIVCHLTPRKGEEFSVRLVVPYVGFSINDADGNRVDNELQIGFAQIADYDYCFVGDDSNDRFQVSLDDNKLNYMCIVNEDGSLSVRDMRDRMALVKEISAQGKLADIMMGAHQMLVKNKSMRWRVQLVGEEIEGAESIEINGSALARFAFEQFNNVSSDDDMETLAQRLIHMEKSNNFQWFWLNEDDWSHEHLEGLLDMEGIDDDPEKMMSQALLYNRYETFMRQLCAFSYLSQKTIQGDQLQARNNKRKIARCVRHILAYRAGEENIWELDEEARAEILHFFSTFHREFTEALEAEQV